MKTQSRHRRTPWYHSQLVWLWFWTLSIQISVGWGTLTLIFWINSIQNLMVLALTILVIICVLGLQIAITTPDESKEYDGRAKESVSSSSI